MKISSSYLRQNGPRLAFVLALVALVGFGLVDPHAAAFGAVALTFETAAGSTLSASATLPGTYDAAGYGALAWTAIGEITDLGQGYGRKYATVEHAPVASRQKTQKKGSFSFDAPQITMAWDQNDAGQDICRTAANNDSVISFKLVKQGGDIRYFTAQVSEFVENVGTVDNVVQGMMTLLRQTDVIDSPA